MVFKIFLWKKYIFLQNKIPKIKKVVKVLSCHHVAVLILSLYQTETGLLMQRISWGNRQYEFCRVVTEVDNPVCMSRIIDWWDIYIQINLKMKLN